MSPVKKNDKFINIDITNPINTLYWDPRGLVLRDKLECAINKQIG